MGEAKLERPASWDELIALSRRDEVLLNCVDEEAEQRMKAVVDQAYRTGDTVGGVFEVVAHGVPPGLGSHIAWDTRLDGKLAQAIVSMQAVKGRRDRVCGGGFGLVRIEGAGLDSLRSRRPAFYARRESGRRFGRRHDQWPGRGGARDVEADFDLAETAGVVDLATRWNGPWPLLFQRHRAVPAWGVIGEAMVALVLAGAALEKFGGDSLPETKRNYEGYLEQVKNF